jgi:hypothetical protein
MPCLPQVSDTFTHEVSPVSKTTTSVYIKIFSTPQINPSHISPVRLAACGPPDPWDQPVHGCGILPCQHPLLLLRKWPAYGSSSSSSSCWPSGCCVQLVVVLWLSHVDTRHL